MNFGIDCPKTVDKALLLGKENVNTLCNNSIAKKMKNIQVAFNIQEKEEPMHVGHQFIKCHINFDVKMEDIHLKARMVAVGHMTETPPNITYTSVMSCDMVRTALTIVELHNLSVKTVYIMNTYITSP